MLKGKLTYTLSVLAILGAIAGYLQGSLDSKAALEMLWVGLAAFGIRRAIS